jgi:hypothetical protein
MDNIFNINIDDDFDVQPIKMTRDEFIKKTKSMLKLILEEYSKNWKNKYSDSDDEIDDSICNRCNGFLFIEQGGIGDVDCPNCNGTGLNSERIFDVQSFMEFLENDVMFGDQPFLNLLNCEIENNDKSILDLLDSKKVDDDFISKCCIGEKCSVCGNDATNKLEETIFYDDLNSMRHPLTAYVCKTHFQMIVQPYKLI